MTRQELIDALCKSPCESLALDCAIQELVDFRPERPKRYTSSLDAARSLVPEGADFEVSRYCDVAFAHVKYSGRTIAATEPLALCAAALKATGDL